MMDEISIEITGVQELIAKLDAAKRPEPLKKGMNFAAGNLVRWIRTNRLTGPRPLYLEVVSGILRTSISFAPTVKSGDVYTTRIGTNVEYAPIHEFGGFAGRNRKVFIRARPFLRPSIEDEGNKKMILEEIVFQLDKAIKEAK